MTYNKEAVMAYVSDQGFRPTEPWIYSSGLLSQGIVTDVSHR